MHFFHFSDRLLSLRRCSLFILFLTVALALKAQLVSQNPQGDLVYNFYANRGQSNAVNKVPDFSRAGYMGGGVALPNVPVRVTINPIAGDDGASIQAAIDQVSALTPDAQGFRGAVLLKAGVYEVAGSLTISTNGVVLRGEGQGAGGTKIIATGQVKRSLIQVQGTGSWVETSGTSKNITSSYVPVGSTEFTVSSAAGFAVGDQIMIERTPNQQWLDDMDNMGQWGWTTANRKAHYERKITAITGNTLQIDAPIVQVIENQYGGGRVFKYTTPGRISKVGVEHLRLESEFDSDTDETHAWTGVILRSLVNGWVRNVTTQYFGYSCVNVVGGPTQPASCKFVTVQDCAMLDPKSKVTGGRRYSFTVGNGGGQFILFQRCYSRGGRHCYTLQADVSGPNVFLDCYARNTKADIGPHQRYATGALFDNVLGGETRVWNRGGFGTGHGWSGAQMMFWNCESRNANSSTNANFRVDSPKGARNWGIGVKIGQNQQGNGYWESVGGPVIPRSLYIEQLRERLGDAAVNNVTTPEQRAGRIWNDLEAWAGGATNGGGGGSTACEPGTNWYNLESKATTYNGKVLQAFDSENGNVKMNNQQGWGNQRWKFVPIGGGSYRIENYASTYAGKVLQAFDSENGNVKMNTWQNWGNQKWQIVETADGFCQLELDAGTYNGKVMQAFGSESGNVKMGTQQNWGNQKWTLVDIGANFRTEGSALPSALIEEATDADLKVYPVPASSTLNIQYESPLEGQGALSIFNMSGQRVRKEAVAIRAGLNDWNTRVDRFPDGTYFLILSTAAGDQKKVTVVFQSK
ncbi:MAG: T9SS type A sorting domain-containing protein [Bacteroidota bacterium]